MSKTKKFILRAIPVFLLVVVVLNTSVFAFDNFERDSFNDLGNGNSSNTLNNAILGVWDTISMVLKLAAVAAIIFAGVRYMFASADQKADIKKSMLILVVGAVLVFGASFIVDLITNVTGEITGG